MTEKRHNEFHIMNDLVIKKLMKDPIILETILRRLLKMEDLKIKSKLDPFQIRIAETDSSDKKFYNTILDLIVECENNIKVILEFQRLKQPDYYKRINVYSSHEISSHFNEIKTQYKDRPTHTLYGYSDPVYVITISESRIIDDDEPYHYAVMAFEGENQQSMDVILSKTGKKVPRDLNVFLELSKYKKEMNHPFKDLLELFKNVAYTVKISDFLKRAETLLDISKWTEEEKKMNIYEEAAIASHYASLEASREEGRNEGINRGINKGIRKGKESIIMQMFEARMSLDSVHKITGFSIEDLKRIKNQIA